MCEIDAILGLRSLICSTNIEIFQMLIDSQSFSLSKKIISSQSRENSSNRRLSSLIISSHWKRARLSSQSLTFLPCWMWGICFCWRIWSLSPRLSYVLLSLHRLILYFLVLASLHRPHQWSAWCLNYLSLSSFIRLKSSYW